MHAADGTAEGLRGCARVGGRAADRVVEDEDAGGAGTGGSLVSASLFEERKQSKERGKELWRDSRIFQQLLCLWVVFPLNLLVV